MSPRRWRKPLATFSLCFALLSPLTGTAHAEELVSQVSENLVFIDTAFDGATLTFAGEIRPGIGADVAAPVGPYHVLMVVRGPGEDRVARGAEPRLGIWLNTTQATFTDVPGFYWLLSSANPDDIISIEAPSRAQLIAMPPFAAATPASPQHAELAPQLRRLMQRDGLYGVNELGVQFLSPRFFTARVTIPHNAPTGLYLARTYVLKDGIVVARNSQSFSVRVVGFERFIAVAAQSHALLYGLGCVALALFTGWLGGVVFRR